MATDTSILAPTRAFPAGNSESPTDPQFGWRGVDTNIEHRPAPKSFAELQRSARATEVEMAINPTKEISDRLTALEKSVATLLSKMVIVEKIAFTLDAMSYQDWSRPFAELAGQVSDLRQDVVSIQKKNK